MSTTALNPLTHPHQVRQSLVRRLEQVTAVRVLENNRKGRKQVARVRVWVQRGGGRHDTTSVWMGARMCLL